MAYKVVITSNAFRDIQRAIDWEEDRSRGLGKPFFKDLEQRLKAIATLPEMGSIRYDDVRCVETKNFQYLIHYIVDINLAYKTKTYWGISTNFSLYLIQINKRSGLVARIAYLFFTNALNAFPCK